MSVSLFTLCSVALEGAHNVEPWPDQKYNQEATLLLTDWSRGSSTNPFDGALKSLLLFLPKPYSTPLFSREAEEVGKGRCTAGVDWRCMKKFQSVVGLSPTLVWEGTYLEGTRRTRQNYP